MMNVLVKGLRISWIICLSTLIFFEAKAQGVEEELEIFNDTIKISGTLVKPSSNGSFPLLIFIHGSGPEKRDNYIDFAKNLIQHGYASFVYDKRGAGKSGGKPSSVQYFSFQDLSDDVVTIVKQLGQRSDVKGGKIGLLATSQGGWVAPLAASKSSLINFMIIISGSVSTVGEDNIFERAARLKKEGFSSTDIEQASEMHKADIALSKNPDSLPLFKQLWDTYKSAPWFKRVYVNESWLNPEMEYRKWYRTVVDFTSETALEKINIPVLWLYGDPELDRLCPVTLSIQRLKNLQNKGKKYEIHSFPKADHGLNIGKQRANYDDIFLEWLNKL